MTDSAPFVLTFDRIDPPLPVENRPAHIFFSLTNYSGQETIGWVTAELYPGSPFFDPARGNARWTMDLENGLTANGVITITPPMAGKNLSLILLYRDIHGNILARESTKVDVAARYTFRLQNCKVEQILGGTHDELWPTMSIIHSSGIVMGSVQEPDPLSGLPGSIVKGGDEVQLNLAIENIDILPGSRLEDTIVLVWSLVNLDSRNSFLETYLGEISNIGQAVASAFTPGDAAQLFNDKMHQLLHEFFSGCNGLAAADRIILTGYQLHEWTRLQDVRSTTKDYHSPQQSAQVVCSGQFGAYSITSTIERQRQPKPNEFLNIFPELHIVMPGQFAVFGTDPEHGHIDPNITWSLEGPPEIYGTINQAGGGYHPPPEINWRTVVVIHAEHKDGRKGLAFARVIPPLDLTHPDFLPPPGPLTPLTPLTP
jgi:hypothetical protein